MGRNQRACPAARRGLIVGPTARLAHYYLTASGRKSYCNPAIIPKPRAARRRRRRSEYPKLKRKRIVKRKIDVVPEGYEEVMQNWHDEAAQRAELEHESAWIYHRQQQQQQQQQIQEQEERERLRLLATITNTDESEMKANNNNSFMTHIPLIRRHRLDAAGACLPDGFMRLPRGQTLKDITLGKGDYGTVYSVCRKNNTSECEFVAKQAIVNDLENDAALRDMYFLSWLSQYLDAKISPQVFGISICNQQQQQQNPKTKQRSRSKKSKTINKRIATIVMEKFQIDGHALMEETAKQFDKGHDGDEIYYVLEEADLLRMFEIVFELDRLGIVHGDIKPDQFLFDRKRNRVVISDFGFAGQMDSTSPTARDPATTLAPVPYSFVPMLGAASDSFKCGPEPGYAQDLDQHHPIVISGLMKWLNRWSLDSFLMYLQVYVWSKTENKLRRYGRLDLTLLPKNVENAFAKICPGIKEELALRNKARVLRNTNKYYNVTADKFQ